MKICACDADGNGVIGCPTCLGGGLLWNDGKPMTRCPGGGAAPLHTDPTAYPCGRRNDHCPGCDRPRDAIPNADDIERTLEHWRTRAASAG